ncbi:MAG TPA: SMP-30/gluconolactonase/LRE family protein, partial [Candidatus Saccharimonadales bacterium]|nr:SMP-30/gluconolactonase/LRE family protein [Candidatus Saccharimonadales bacterium]
ERGEGGFALPIEIRDSSNILFANLHMYRVVSSLQPYPTAIRVWNSKNISFRNLHCYSDSKVSFDNSLRDETHHVNVRQREISWLDISGQAPPAKSGQMASVVAEGARLEQAASGFYNISGGAVDTAGNIYFVDAKWQTIYRWSATTRQLSKIRENPLDPVNLAFDKSGNLLVISYSGNGTVYSFKPDSGSSDVTLLKAEPAVARPGMTPVLPVIHWRNENDFTEKIPVKKPYQFVSPDHSTFIPAGEDFVKGQLYYGSKIHDVIRAFGLSPATIGQTYYVSDESEEKTYAATVEPDGTLSNLKLFAEVGGEGITTDADGNVYIAAGQVFVYDRSGKLIDTIEVPERPTQLLFGGGDGRTLFIAARSSLYSVETKHKGR